MTLTASACRTLYRACLSTCSDSAAETFRAGYYRPMPTTLSRSPTGYGGKIDAGSCIGFGPRVPGACSSRRSVLRLASANGAS